MRHKSIKLIALMREGDTWTATYADPANPKSIRTAMRRDEVGDCPECGTEACIAWQAACAEAAACVEALREVLPPHDFAHLAEAMAELTRCRDDFDAGWEAAERYYAIPEDELAGDNDVDDAWDAWLAPVESAAPEEPAESEEPGESAAPEAPEESKTPKPRIRLVPYHEVN